MDPKEQFLDTWRINSRLNQYVLEAIPFELLGVKLEKGKTVGSQFAHIHNVRLMWLKASAPDLLEGLAKVEVADDKAGLLSALSGSADAVEALLARGYDSGKVKNFKPHAMAFLGYLISHEANHRGHAELALRQAGVPLDDKVSYGIWEWGSR
jgi:uncharacterized damage-inducible protein DinB